MKQTGFLYKKNPNDYITGASPIQWEIVMPDGDWRPYVPSEEQQYTFEFDTMSCTTFSALNAIEHFVNFLVAKGRVSPTQLEKLKTLGYFQDGKFNCSDRFTAIMSGTMPNGNYFPNVMDSVRFHTNPYITPSAGLLPDKDFPFGGNTWEEYHDKTKITQAMKDKARKIWEIFEFAYEWTPITDTSIELAEALKQAPVQVAVTASSPRHAIMLPKIDWEFETYAPFLRPRKRTIAYAMKILVKVKPEVSGDHVTITRQNFSTKQITGTLTAKLGTKTFTCKTLELADKNNQKNISCIPKGKYKAIHTYSPKFKKYTYELLSVPNRSGIRIHSANYYFQINGCIALGTGLTDINKDGHLDTINSRVAVASFEKFLDKRPFTLEIK